MDKMSLLEMQDAFVEDSLSSTIAMTNEVYTPDEILNNFGSITYAKGERSAMPARSLTTK